uniref:Uncharacterized protein LOC102805208 n=1 Tax=Saccoglossus kowalevskii TaxID=10224 RepID=A0ABM0LUL2_SACKO|nr:PREDICTED: uncharacterized protein LOC102805208 [Saccoglossus kowalevskii]
MGYDSLVVYLDDFLVITESYESCIKAVNVLIRLLRNLGFSISWRKVEGPTQRISFIGITIDSRAMRLELSNHKQAELIEILTSFETKTRANKRQLQSLAGELNWAAQVAQGGRGSHGINANYPALHCWRECMAIFNGRPISLNPWPISDLHMDASNYASGIYFKGDWQYTVWELDWPQTCKLHINYKEVLSLYLAACRWAPYCQNKLDVHTDNTIAQAIINKDASPEPIVMTFLRHLFWMSVLHNFHIQAVHIPGHINDIPGAISRLHQPDLEEKEPVLDQQVAAYKAAIFAHYT